ncbi:MAG: hypothetical protein K1X47_16110 [Cyclobacteriaceae bacterium]|nr:hypothetical protein [Cyclobacteriaceae bacterium]
MVSLDDFSCYTFDQKCDLIISDSSYVSHRKLGDCKIYLYHAHGFFIEVYYAPSHRRVLMIHAFDGLEGLELYTEEVSLKEIGF